MLVVPTSRSVAPLTPMMSGMRKLPPISMSWPRDTTTSRPAATARSVTTVAAAQLLEAVAERLDFGAGGGGDEVVGVALARRDEGREFEQPRDRGQLAERVLAHGG